MTLQRIEEHRKAQGLIIASDEAGCGPWAGPLVVCAASAPPGWTDARIQDSKRFSGKAKEGQREALYDEIVKDPRFIFTVIIVESDAVDRMGVYRANQFGHKAALRGTVGKVSTPALIVVDGKLPVETFGLGSNIIALPKADALVRECSLASIIAKVVHDRLMREHDKTYPGYGFAEHKGYGTEQHEAALDKLGICPIHRRSFSPIKKREEGLPKSQNIFDLMDEFLNE